MNNKGFAPLILVIIIAVIGIAGYFAYQNSQLKKAANQNQLTLIPQTSASPTVSPSATPNPAQTKICSNNYLGVTLNIPSAWDCKSMLEENLGWIEVTSSIFTIQLANGGRDGYCTEIILGSDPPQRNPDCVISNYYNNPKIGLNLSLYRYKGENKEIFGTYKNTISGFDGFPWVSIKWLNMEKGDLTMSEKADLTSVLDSIKFTQ